MSGTLALSSAIAAMSRDALAELVVRRRPQAVSGIVDPIGLAVELLRADSIERALRPLDRGSLAAIVSPEHASVEQLSLLTALGLLGVDEGRPVALPEAGAALAASLDRVGLTVDELIDPVDAGPPQPADTASWYVPALASVAIAAETLRALRTRPGSLNRSGSVAVATVKALADSTGIPAHEISCALDALIAGGLLAPMPHDALLAWTSGAAEWLELPSPERWARLAGAVAAGTPAPLRALLREASGATDTADADGLAAGIDLAAVLRALPQRYPLLAASTVAAVDRYAELAAHLGLAVGGTLSEAGRSLVTQSVDDADGALAIARRDMPAPAPGVYIQPDLSVIVPGPLSPADETALVTFSRPEQTGIASTRRITEAALAEAFEQGLGVGEARAMLERLSLTGIPQPLEYMLASLGERIRSIVVHEHDGDEGRTRLEVSRAELRDTLLVDRALHHLQLAPSAGGDALYSKLRAEHVVAALVDARYTASYADLPGRAAPRLAVPAEPRAGLPADLVGLVDRVHAAAAAEPDASGFTRRLELAIKDRSTVRVTASAQGRTHIFTLLPTSLDAGRLRATDPGAGVERTLPVSTITAVE
ncbi:helicase-associated domain-containing protein [Leucobacter sp. GX0328]